MNFIFNIIYSAHANGTHEKLALDSLRYLETDNAPAWHSLFLNHAEPYLSGCKAPDHEFKDYKNHVLHVRDNYWGGAPEKAESWYNLLVRELQQNNWEQAVWCAGVLSHYYTDPIHPFNTAKCEAENNIHRALEWSISRSYNDLRKRGLKSEIPEIHIGNGETWLREMVINGAELANCYYESLIAGYNFRQGVSTPTKGLDVICRNLIGRLLVYASIGFSKILDRAFEESHQVPPHMPLASETFMSILRIPRKWSKNRVENANELKSLRRMYDEFKKTGQVDKSMNEEQKAIRDLHTQEVLIPLASQREVQRARRCEPLSHLQNDPVTHDTSQDFEETYFQSEMPMNSNGQIHTQYSASANSMSSANSGNLHDLHDLHELQDLHELHDDFPSNQMQQQNFNRTSHLRLSDHVEASPSVGPKTAERLEALGIVTIKDLLDADPQSLAGKLNIRYVNRKAILDWQDQARLMLHIPGLRETHAQLCIGAGYRTPEHIATANPAEISDSILKFAATRSGQRILGSGKPPDFYTIREWISNVDKGLAA
ncbi:MAG: hypothetical protein TECD_00887 [Hyphomicrobiaceae bacterium hypho_1]